VKLMGMGPQLGIKITIVLMILGCHLSLHAQTTLNTAPDESINTENIKAPPRDVKDILRALEQSKPDLATVAKNKEIIAKQAPNTQDKEELNRFYFQQAKAYQGLGMIGKAIKDAQRAAYEYPSKNPRLQVEDLINLGVLEGLGGQHTAAIAALEKAMDYQKSTIPNLSGIRMTMGRLLVGYYATAGNFSASKQTLDDLENNIKRLKNARNVKLELMSYWDSQLESARGIYFNSQAQWVESERSLRKAIQLLELNYNKVSNSIDNVDSAENSLREVADAGNSSRGYITQIIHRQINLSTVLLQQRKLTDAEYYARKALTLALEKFGRNSADAGRALASLAAIIDEQGRTAEAVLLAQAAFNSAKESGAPDDALVIVKARQALGSALVADGKYAQADTVFNEMVVGIKRDPDLAKNYRSGDLDWVLALLKTGKASQAAQMTGEILRHFEAAGIKNSSRVALVRAFEATALQAQGKWSEANALYKNAIPTLLDQSRNDAENDTSTVKQLQRMNFILENYLAELAHIFKTDPTQANAAAAEAFKIADIARGSGVQRALTASAARASIKDPQLALLARQEQDMQRRINTLSELLTGLLSSAPDQQLPAVQVQIRTDIDKFKTQREDLKKEIEKRFPEYAELVEPKPATIAGTQRLLRPDEVLVSWYFAENVGYVWSISKDTPPQFVQIPLGRAQMAKEITQLRKALDPGVATIDEIPAFDIVLAYQLYQQILAPVESSLKGKKVMLVVPHAELGQLPLALLVTKATVQPSKAGVPFAGYKAVPWLSRDIAIAQIPSVTALAALRNLPAGSANRKNFIGFGDPYFSMAQEKSAKKNIAPTQLAMRGAPLKLRSAPKTTGVSSAELSLLPRLPDTSQEIEEVGKVLGAEPGDIFLHQQATVKQVTTMDLSNRKVVMFSTHGLVPGELNGLTQPALALSSPDVTGDKDDGLLTMDKVIALKLNADWVVLSACNTAAGEGSGSEAVSGLGRAFFFAGAKALLVSNWPVDSVASRQLMTDLFKRQQQTQGLNKSEALRQAMLAQIDIGGVKEGATMKYSYAHPLFWAPFVVVGD